MEGMGAKYRYEGGGGSAAREIHRSNKRALDAEYSAEASSKRMNVTLLSSARVQAENDELVTGKKSRWRLTNKGKATKKLLWEELEKKHAKETSQMEREADCLKKGKEKSDRISAEALKAVVILIYSSVTCITVV